MKARDMMNSEVVTVQPDDTTDRAIDLMLRHRISGLPVVDKRGRLLGIVSEFDLLELTCDCWTEKNELRHYMSRDVCTVDEEEDWTTVARIFRSNHLRRLPVMHEDEFVGIITRHDVVRAIQEVRRRIKETVPWPEARSSLDEEARRPDYGGPWMPKHGGNKRILLIDDNPSIHDEFGEILCVDQADTQSPGEAAWFPSASSFAPSVAAGGFEIDSAYEGEEGLEMIRTAAKRGCPYAMVFVDGGLAGGWQGAETVCHIRQEYPDLQIIFCTSYSDRRSEDLAEDLGPDEHFFVLKKPLDRAELRQLAVALAQRKQAEREMQDYAATLEEARNAAQSASRAKSEFIANLTHEIRTPMNAILGFSRSLMKEPLAADQLEKLGHIHDAGKALLGMIDDILDYSQLSAGELELHAIDFNLDRVVRNVLEAAVPIAREKGLSIQYIAHSSLPPLHGDQVRLRQVLRNLLDNAIKFTPHGKVEIHTRLEAETDQTASVRVTVTDTGIGIAEDAQVAIFDSFFQVDGSRTRQFEGVGLGLAICKGLVQLMGGQIGVQSNVGKGSSFWVTATLPKASASQGHKASPKTETASGSATLSAPPSAGNEKSELPCSPEDCLLALKDALKVEDFSHLEEQAGKLRDLALLRRWNVAARCALGVRLASRSKDSRRIAAAIRKLEDALPEDRAENIDHPTRSDALAPLEEEVTMKCLIVDDCHLARTLLENLLSPYGQCDLVADGREALDAFELALEEDEPYDLVCLDIMMPGMDGHEVLDGMRRMERRWGIYCSDGAKVIMTTALSDSKNCIRSFTEGCEAYITKPIDEDQLLSQVRSLLGGLAPPATDLPAATEATGRLNDRPSTDRYLIVDDDRLCRELLRDILSRYGRCDFACNGEEALDAVRAALADDNPYDLICLDIMMPGISGHEVLEAIRELEAEHRIYCSDGVKVIMTTALGDAGNVIQSFREGCESYVVKPIDEDLLLAKMRELGLSHRHAAAVK